MVQFLSFLFFQISFSIFFLDNFKKKKKSINKGKGTTKKLRHGGMAFANWVCQMAETQTITSIAPILLSGFLKSINDSEFSGGDLSITKFSGVFFVFLNSKTFFFFFSKVEK